MTKTRRIGRRWTLRRTTARAWRGKNESNSVKEKIKSSCASRRLQFGEEVVSWGVESCVATFQAPVRVVRANCAVIHHANLQMMRTWQHMAFLVCGSYVFTHKHIQSHNMYRISHNRSGISRFLAPALLFLGFECLWGCVKKRQDSTENWYRE